MFKFSEEFEKQLEIARERIKKAPIDRKAIREIQDREYFANNMRQAARKMLGREFQNCTFDNYIINDNNKEAFKLCYDLANGYYDGISGILLSGNNGIGKNHLAAAIVNALAEKMIPCYFGSIVKIKTKICDAFDTGVGGAIESLMHYKVVCINDLGAEREPKDKNSIDFTQELLFSLIDRLYEEKHTLIVTTNLDADNLFDRYGPRIVSRILGMGESIRFEDFDHRVVN